MAGESFDVQNTNVNIAVGLTLGRFAD
jgi:hypothetical protein